MRLCHRLVAFALTTITSTVAVTQPVDWQRYVVSETGATADIPTTIFSKDGGQPAGGYGRRFLTADGRANLTLQSLPNPANISPSAFLAEMHPPSGIVYRRVTSRFFVVSSFRDGNIWYDRCNSVGAYMNCVLINYPAAEKRRWDSVVTRISNTLGTTR